MLQILGVAGAIIAILLIIAKSVDISQKQKLSRSWTPVPAKIVRSDVERSGISENNYYPRVVYQYEVDGKKYECSRIRINEYWNFSFESQAEKIIRPYRKTAQVTAYVNPEDHKEAILEPGS